MKVVLINPPAKKVQEVRYDTPKFPHLGLGYLAGYLRGKNIECKPIDAKFEGLDIEQIIGRVAKEKPRIVGLTAMTHEVSQAAFVAHEVKKIFPDVLVFLGGVHATALPEETLKKYPQFDLLVTCEGELTLYDICEKVRAKEDLSEVQGIAYKKDGSVVVNKRREFIMNLDELPFPAWDLFPRAEEYLVITSRGCPFNCNFCMRPNGQMVRKRSAENVIKELEWIKMKFNPESIVFCDEVLTIDKERANKIFDTMIERKLDLKWHAQTHVKMVDLELLKKMKKSGCYLLGVGIESGNEEIINNIGKSATKEDIRNAIKLIKEAEIPVEGYFILGHPNETKETIKETINFATELNVDLPVFGIMVPYPGTKIGDMAKKGEGGYKLKSDNWDDYNKQLGDALEFTQISRKELEMWQLKAYLAVFMKNKRFKDLSKFMWKYKKEGMSFLKKLVGA